MKRVLSWLFMNIAILTAASQSITYSSSAYNSVWSVPLQIPVEVRWLLNRSDIGQAERSPAWRFKPDLPKSLMRVRHQDYNNSGYDRGHLCPAQDRSKSTSDMKRTFFLSNVCPQLHSVNAGGWKITENIEREIAKREDSCRVIAMPIFVERDTLRIGPNGIAVPHAFLKIIYNVNPDTLYKIYFLWNK